MLQEVQAVASQGTASGEAPPLSPKLCLNLLNRLISLQSKLTSWPPWRPISLTKSWLWWSNGRNITARSPGPLPKGLCLNPAGVYLACAFCRGRSGNPVEFSMDAGLKNHFLRQSGSSKNWHHASQAAYGAS